MADYEKDLDKTGGAGQKTQHKIRITLTSRNVKPLEKCESRLLVRRGDDVMLTMSRSLW